MSMAAIMDGSVMISRWIRSSQGLHLKQPGITWFFANAYTLLKDESLLDEAKHGFAFMKDYCFDKENGGIYWSITYDGKPEDTTKHTYNPGILHLRTVFLL